MTAEQEENERGSSAQLQDRFIADLRKPNSRWPDGASAAATMAVAALVEQAIAMAVRQADGTVDEVDAREIFRGAVRVLRITARHV